MPPTQWLSFRFPSLLWEICCLSFMVLFWNFHDFLPSFSLLSAITILFRKSKWERTRVTYCCSHDAAARPQRRRCSSRLLSASFVASPFHPVFLRCLFCEQASWLSSTPAYLFAGAGLPSRRCSIVKRENCYLKVPYDGSRLPFRANDRRSGFWFIGVFMERKILPAV